MSREWVVRILVLAAAVLLTFGGAVFTDRVFYERDILNYWGPHIEVFVRAAAEHAWPLWNPYAGFGAPLMADPSLALAYPPTWLNLVLAPSTYYKLLVVGHCAWGGLGVLLLARHLRLAADASLVAALAYCLSGPFLSAASLFHHYTGAAWMPWVLLGLQRLLRSPSAGSALRLGVAAAMQILAGSGDLCLMTLVAAVFLVGLEGPVPKLLTSARTLRFGLLALVLAAGLAAVQWIPTRELLASGARPRQGDQSLYWSLHPASVPDLAAHGAVSGLPLSPAAREALFEGRDPLLSSIYWGPVTLVLALVGVVLPGPGRARLAGGLLFFLMAALGRHTPFYPLLLHLPVFPLLRYPIKYLWGASLFAALLAGLGVSSWTRPWSVLERKRAALVGLCAGLAALAALSYAAAVYFRLEGIDRWLAADAKTPGRLDSSLAQALVAALLFAAGTVAVFVRRAERPVPWAALAVLLVGGDLARAGFEVNPLAPRALFQIRPALLDTLRAGGAPRVYSAGSRPQVPVEMPVRGPAGWRPEWSRTLGVIDRLIPPTPSRWGLFGSFDGDFTGLAGRTYSEMTTLTNAVRDRVEGTVLLRLAGVDYVVTLDPGVFGGSLPEAARVDSVYASPVLLLSVPHTFPRVFVVDGIRPVAEADAQNVLVAGGFDPSREVLVSGPAEASPGRAGFRGSARLLSRRADSLSLEADLDGPGVLVVLEAYHPGWQAEVDGRPTSVLRANALFRGIPLAAGHHRVEMAFRPPSALLGAALSLLSLLGALAIWAFEARKPGGRLSAPTASQ
jgi:Bacterial membrane protein YfhO